MSSLETRVGKIRILPGNAEEASRNILISKGLINEDSELSDIAPYADSFYEALTDDFDYYESYVKIDGILYEVEEEYSSKDEEGFLFVSEPESDGTRKYILQYHNGGASFEEALEAGIKG